MKKVVLSLTITLLSVYYLQSQNPLLLRQPAINKDGSLVAFSFKEIFGQCPIRVEEPHDLPYTRRMNPAPYLAPMVAKSLFQVRDLVTMTYL